MIRRHGAWPNRSPFRLKRLAQSKLVGWPINGLLADDPFVVKARTAIVKSAHQRLVLNLSSSRPMVTSGLLTVR